MRLLRPATEDEMIAVFLRAELASPRFGGALRAMLDRDWRDEDVLLSPDIDDAAANRYRRRLLDEHRAYERREGLFSGFPEDVRWHRAALAPAEVLAIRYIDWDGWLELSGGTRSPREAARRILAGAIPDVDLVADEAIAAALVSPRPPPELIAVTSPASEKLVLVEGHVRLTAYATFPAYLPHELEILLGVSPTIDAWSEY